MTLHAFLPPAIDLFTTIVYHEPVMLSNLLDRGLPGVILNSFIMKDVRGGALTAGERGHSLQERGVTHCRGAGSLTAGERGHSLQERGGGV